MLLYLIAPVLDHMRFLFQSVHSFVYLILSLLFLSVYLCGYLHIYVSLYLSKHLSTYLAIYFLIYGFIYLCVSLFVYRLICLFIYLSVFSRMRSEGSRFTWGSGGEAVFAKFCVCDRNRPQPSATACGDAVRLSTVASVSGVDQKACQIERLSPQLYWRLQRRCLRE